MFSRDAEHHNKQVDNKLSRCCLPPSLSPPCVAQICGQFLQLLRLPQTQRQCGHQILISGQTEPLPALETVYNQALITGIKRQFPL